MDDLSTLLRTASDGAPPTGIDLDALIATEGRRRTRWDVASAAAVASVLVLTGLLVALPDRARPRTVPVAPIPAVITLEPCVHASLPASVPDRAAVVPRLGPPPETPAAAVRRLTAALPALLPRAPIRAPGPAAPGASSTTSGRPSSTARPRGSALTSTRWPSRSRSLRWASCRTA